MLPIGIGAQAKNVGQGLARDQKIRLLTHPAQQVQRHHAAGRGQPRQQSLRLFAGGGTKIRTGSSLRAAHAGFDKRRRRRGQLRPPGQIKTQGVPCQPALCIVEGKEGALVLAPVRRPCCLELLCCQDDSALSKPAEEV
jgi:hypothetical protein